MGRLRPVGPVRNRTPPGPLAPFARGGAPGRVGLLAGPPRAGLLESRKFGQSRDSHAIYPRESGLDRQSGRGATKDRYGGR
jgi:hypothetical protein